jgi:iron complex transport system substrate-binding protein
LTTLSTLSPPNPTYLDALTRREFLSGLLAAAALTACGGSAGPAGPSSASRTVDSSHGPVKIPANPQRVVAMHDQLVAYAVASLGFERMVAVAVRDASDPAVAIRQFGEVPGVFKRLSDIGTYSEPNLEAIAGVKPDLIIGLPYEVDPIYDRLSAIAPTVVIDLVPGDRPPFQRQRDLAAVVGVEEELDERLADYRSRLAAVKARVGTGMEGAVFSYLESYGTGAEDNYAIKSPYAPGLVAATDLGMKVSASTRALAEEYTAVSLERLADFDADVIFVGVPEDSTLDPRVSTFLANTTAGRAEQVFTVSRDVWALEVAEALFVSLNDLEKIFTGRQVAISGSFAG